MERLISLFPFIRIDRPENILGLTLKPAVEETLYQLDKGERYFFQKVEEEIKMMGGRLDKFTLVYDSSEKVRSSQEVSKKLKKISDLLRFKLSYKDEDFDYDQGLYVIYISSTEGSTKVSVNGGRETLIESKIFSQRMVLTTGAEISLSEKKLPKSRLLNIDDLYYVKPPHLPPDEERFWRAIGTARALLEIMD